MVDLLLDLETKSEVPIKDGTWVYAAGAEILLLAYAIDDGDVHVWDRASGEVIPKELELALGDPDVTITAHNASFDRTVMLFCSDALVRAAAQDVYRWRCTMAQAYAHGLPGSLDALGRVLRIAADKQKLKTGKELMRLFCIPPAKNLKRGWATRETHPVEWEEFKEYAGQDIVTMREARRLMPIWNYKGAELALWHLDQQINARGVCMDTDLAEAAVRATDIAQAELAARTQELTGDEVRAATQRDALLKHLLASYGVDLPDLQSATLERRIDDPNLPDAVRELLAIRLQASSTSVAKYKKLLRGTSEDGRLRGTLQFCGAARTGRWAGRLVQLQNLPRPTLLQSLIDAGIIAAKTGDGSGLPLVVDSVMQWAASALRGFIIAPPGKKLVVCDLSNIEGRVAAWLAGETWKLQAFRDFDAGTGHDLYKLAYARAFDVDPGSVTKDQRQIGKVMELMLQYGGGVGAFITGAATYGIDLDAMAEAAWPTLPQDVIDEASSFLDWLYEKSATAYEKKLLKLEAAALSGEISSEQFNTKMAALDEALAAARLKANHGLKEKTFIVCDSLKRLWRGAQPAISSYWKELENMVKAAINTPGVTFPARKLKVRVDGAWLRIGLPSGRAMCFPNPEVDGEGRISYMGIDQYTRAWQRISTYGGKLLEGPTQAVARDQLAYPMELAEMEGYDIVTHMHDELVTEAPDDPAFNAESLAAIMCAQFPWNEGLPLSAAGFETSRYYKG